MPYGLPATKTLWNAKTDGFLFPSEQRYTTDYIPSEGLCRTGYHFYKNHRTASQKSGERTDAPELFNGFEQAAFEQGAPEAGPGRQGQTILKGEPDDREDRLRGRFHLPLLDALRHFADQIRKRRLEFFAFALAEGLFEARGRVLPQQVVVREKFSQFGVAQPVFDDGAEHFGFFKVFARELGKRVELVECLPERLMCSVNKNSPVSPAKRTTRVGIFDVTQNGRGRGPWVDLPWGGAKPLPKPF